MYLMLAQALALWYTKVWYSIKDTSKLVCLQMRNCKHNNFEKEEKHSWKNKNIGN